VVEEAEPVSDKMQSGRPGPAEVDELLRAAAAAPSSYNSQPWRLRWTGEAVEVRGDPERLLTHTDPDGRQLRLACGAALTNVGLMARAQGRRVLIRLLPDPGDPWLLGSVRLRGASPPLPWEQKLAEVILSRHTDRGPFGPPGLSLLHRDELAQAAERERCPLVVIDRAADLARLRDITSLAHREQRADPGFVAEWDSWIGAAGRTDDGIPPAVARTSPRSDDGWRPRDFAGGSAPADAEPARPDGRPDEQPTIAIVATSHDNAISQVRAGLAMEQVLLTAAAHGLGASFVAPPLEQPHHRGAVRDLLGGVLWPQAILRLGVGGLPRATPRRRPAQV
jgi:nitroreductase